MSESYRSVGLADRTGSGAAPPLRCRVAKLMRAVTILDAPSNLGLRPAQAGTVPGCYKLGWALREAGLIDGLDAVEAGVVLPPRYRADWAPGNGDRNAAAIASYSVRLADRIESLIGDSFLVLLGGDCSVLIGAALALRRRGRYGLAFLDGHTDFRHPDNSDAIDAAAGEDLAIVTGRGDPRLTNLETLGPYVRDADVVAVGIRPNDDHLNELQGLGFALWPMERLRAGTVQGATKSMLSHLTGPQSRGFWVHLDVDILDAEVMPAVDSPAPGGLLVDELVEIVLALTAHPSAVGMDVTILDPDLDPDGEYAEILVGLLRAVLTLPGPGAGSSAT